MDILLLSNRNLYIIVLYDTVQAVAYIIRAIDGTQTYDENKKKKFNKKSDNNRREFDSELMSV